MHSSTRSRKRSRVGDTVTFTGFGKFSTSNRAAREGVNPRNPGQKVHIPAATVPKFSAGSTLKTAVKQAERGGPVPHRPLRRTDGRSRGRPSRLQRLPHEHMFA